MVNSYNFGSGLSGLGLWGFVFEGDEEGTTLTWLKPGEERNLRHCIFVDPPDSAVLEGLQPLLDDL